MLKFPGAQADESVTKRASRPTNKSARENGPMTITLSHDQEAAVARIREWRHGDDQSFTLGGYAGTGKTTIIRAIIEGESNVVCATPTGKAAAVLGGKLNGLNVEVGTLHSLLYRPVEVTEEMVTAAEDERDALRAVGLDTTLVEKRIERLIKKLEEGSCEFGLRNDPEFKPLVIVDECSMVGDRIESDLRAIAGKILFVGDPGQLPPVEGTEFFERNRPDVVLETIHRQAADSAILRMAHAVRNGERFDGWNETDCVIGDVGDLDLILSADQVITGKNETRRRLNKLVRKARGFSGKYPQKGERLICLRNEHGRGLINGVGAVAASDCQLDEWMDLSMDVSYEDRLFRGLPIDPFAFECYANPKLTRRDMPPTPDSQFDFGHCITVHKSQGSEWDHVLVWDDKMRRHDREARKRWIYTAATRAAKRLTWVSAG